MDTIEEAATNGESYNDLRKLLAQFSFRGNSVKKVISQLSGGEKARVVLCMFMLRPANLLVLDEVRIYLVHFDIVHMCALLVSMFGVGHNNFVTAPYLCCKISFLCSLPTI